MNLTRNQLLLGLAVLTMVTLAIQVSGRLWREPPPPPLMVGTNLWLGYEPLHLARELDFFEKEDVRLVDYSSATQVIQAFRNKGIQAAALTLDEVLLLRETGIDVTIILANDISDGGDVVLGRPGITSLDQLKGKSVGVETSALGAYVLARALQSVNLKQGDVRVVPLEVDEHESAFESGELDAVVTFEPVRSKLLEGGASLLFDSSQIPGEIVDVVVVRRELLMEREGQLITLLRGWYRALEYLEQKPDDACEKMAKRLGISPDEVLKGYEGLHLPDQKETAKMLRGDPAPLTETARKLAAVMKEAGLMLAEPELDDLTAPGPLLKLGSADDNE
ncbi:MAG: NitT/TauT family transport system substrate-binding protein [Verrucomicrobiales bacterium]|jgi:NitT/TauT family transport system substrate-binding protein